MIENRQEFVVKETGASAPDAQEVTLCRKCANIVLSGELDDNWPEIALKTQRVMDAVIESANDDSRKIAMG